MHLMEPEGSLPLPQIPAVRTFRNMIRFYGETLLAPHLTPKLEDNPLSAVRNCLSSIFVDNLHIGGRSSIRYLRTRHAVVTRTHLSRMMMMVMMMMMIIIIAI
jgi:hypothetical protein